MNNIDPFRNKKDLIMRDPYDCSAKRECAPNTSCGRCFNNIVDSRGFVLMLTPKSATQSIIQAYRQSRPPGAINWFHKSDVERRKGHMFIAGFARNPFDRVASCWQWWCVKQYHRTWPIYGLERNMPFADFIDVITKVPYNQADKHWRPVSYDVTGADGTLIPDMMVRFEHLSDDFGAVRMAVKDRTGAALGQLPHRNHSNKGDYRKMYTPEMVDKVAEYYKADIDNFDYGFE